MSLMLGCFTVLNKHENAFFFLIGCSHSADGFSVPLSTETETETELDNATDSQEEYFENQYRRRKSSDVSDLHDENHYQKGNADKLFSYIEENILSFGRSISTQQLTEIFGISGYDRRSRYYVKNIIKEKYGDKLIFLTVSTNEPQVVLRSISHTSDENLLKSNKESVLKQAADILRDDIDSFLIEDVQKQSTWPPTVDSLKVSHQRYPKSLSLFFSNLLKNKKHAATETVTRHVDSIIQDIVNSVSNGNVATLKHILIGCGLHSLTGSKKIIQILNRLNNSCTYERVRQIETAQAELAQQFTKRDFPLPLVPKDESSKVFVRFWWDNFDSIK